MRWVGVGVLVWLLFNAVFVLLRYRATADRRVAPSPAAPQQVPLPSVRTQTVPTAQRAVAAPAVTVPAQPTGAAPAVTVPAQPTGAAPAVTVPAQPTGAAPAVAVPAEPGELEAARP